MSEEINALLNCKNHSVAVINVCKYMGRQEQFRHEGMTDVSAWFFFYYYYFNTSLCGIIALHFPDNALCNMQQDFVQVATVTLCLVWVTIMILLKYYCATFVLFISEVLRKYFRPIMWCCSMTSGGVCDESNVLYFSWCVHTLLHIIILPCVGKMIITASPETKLLNLKMSKNLNCKNTLEQSFA